MRSCLTMRLQPFGVRALGARWRHSSIPKYRVGIRCSAASLAEYSRSDSLMKICQALDLSAAHGVDIYRPHWRSPASVRVLHVSAIGVEGTEQILVSSTD